MARLNDEAIDRIRTRLRGDTAYWCRAVGFIVNKRGEKVPFALNSAQLALDADLEAQRAAGKPQRAIVLKARQVGISTYVQAKLVQRATQLENHTAVTIAHNLETGTLLYRMGERFYVNLPDEDDAPEDEHLGLKPGFASHRRGRFMHFGDKFGEAAQLYPDSTYYVDTAGEFQAGRGATYRSVHGSEVAFWPDPLTKLTGLLQAVPDDPDTLMVLESTANGVNMFKDLWDDAEAGRSEYVAFFWPWFKYEEYALAFANEAERAAFRVGEGPYGEDEPNLVKLLEGEGYSWETDVPERERIPERLHWRRWMIANKIPGGRLELFKQEFPSTPEEAFIASGRQVFDPFLVQGILLDVDRNWDPRHPSEDTPGPERGKLKANKMVKRSGRVGQIEVPEEPLWVPRADLEVGEMASWRIFERPKADSQYVIGVDVSGGVAGGEKTEDDDPAWDAIQVIDHSTRVQMAEFRARVDEDILAEQCYLAARWYNDAWLAIETTGGWGLPVANKCWKDWHYPFIYFKHAANKAMERQQDNIGFDTNVQTKPMLHAHTAEMLREGTHGIRSRALAGEMKTYVREPSGKTRPEPNRFSDLLMAWMIAQLVATIMPIKTRKKDGKSTSKKRRTRRSVR